MVQFENMEEYDSKYAKCKNDFGGQIEEFEIQFIDGDDLDYNLFKALDIHQGNSDAFFAACEEWNEDQKIKVIIAVGEAGYSFDPCKDDPDDFDIELYELDSLRDLGIDYSETTINGTHMIYWCS